MQLIIIRGTPGAGKSSLGRRLKKIYAQGALIEVDNVRGMMNNVNWEGEKEHLIALEVAATSAKIFLGLKTSPVIIVDMFMPDKLNLFLNNFSGIHYKVISLLVNEKVLHQRLTDRKEGFKNHEKGILLNKQIQKNPCA
ncbi:MAG TPA: AAA family ATPase, partial [Bacteroidia bacterium]|nr:AAA family ATPase [Bacteroidia bacterium]